MKLPVILLALGAVARSVLAADKPMEVGLIELPGEHIVLTEGTLSADGHYAAGWTVYPKKGKPPVKWNALGKENSSFLDDYLDNEGYLVVDVIVDLPRRAIAEKLSFKEPYFNGKNHGGLEVVYGPEHDGHRYAIALSDSKWETSDVALVDLAADGATQSDLHKTIDGAVLNFVRSKSKRGSSGYATDYQLFSLPELGLLTGFSDATTVRVPFNTGIPKGETTPSYSGTVLLHLKTANGHPHAEPGEVRQTPDNPEPTSDDPRIVEADKELNTVYAALRGKLSGTAKTKLAAEQRDWIKQRDGQIEALKTANTDKTFVDNQRLATDRLLLQLTKERTAVLRAH